MCRKASFSRHKSILTVSLLILTVCACARTQRLPFHRDTIIVANSASPTNIDPRIGIDKASENFHHLLFNGLLRKDEDGRMVPDLVASYEKVNPLLFRFHLRKNVHFHNGKVLDANDVAFTYNSILNGAVSSTKRSALESLDVVRAIGPLDVEIVLKEPFNGLLVNLNLGIIPANSRLDFARNPIGTGPYRLTYYDHDSEAKFEAFSHYFEGAPRTRFLVIRVIPDATTRALELRRGTVDLELGASIVPPHYFHVLKSDSSLRTLLVRGNNYAYIGFNMRDPILKDKRIRQAIAYAVNRNEVITDLLYNAGTAASGLLAPQHWAYEGKVKQFSFNPSMAKRILDDAGYRDPDGDGPQKRFWISYKISTDEFRRTVATVFQRDLDRVGIGMKIRSYEWGTFFSDINHGNFQLCMLLWVGEGDPDIYRNIFATNGTRNRGKYSDPQVDEWLVRAREAPTEKEQKKYYSLVQKKVAEDCPYVSLWYESNIAIFRAGLQGMRLTPDADFRVIKDVYW